MKGEKKESKITLQEKDKQALFAVLAVVAVALVSYVAFFAEAPGTPSDLDTFVGYVLGSSDVALFLDARGADTDSARIVFQCGVDIAGGSLFGSKTISTYACDDNECISVNSEQNGSSKLTYDTVKRNLRGVPYIIVKSGAPDTKFFTNHAEISVDASYDQSCRLG